MTTPTRTEHPIGDGIVPIAHHPPSRERLASMDPANPLLVCHICELPVWADEDLYVHLLDRNLHRTCLGKFLATTEGERIISVGGQIYAPDIQQLIILKAQARKSAS